MQEALSTEEHARLDAAISEAIDAARHAGSHRSVPARLRSALPVLRDVADRLNEHPGLDPELAPLLGNLLPIIERRLVEIETRWSATSPWIWMTLDELEASLRQFFVAVEHNARGHYHIAFDVADKQPHDYLVELALSSRDGQRILMPALLSDVIRDLAANARKYTRPGGHIVIAVGEEEGMVVVTVQDSGMGIPADELPHVAQFGYRGKNARQRPTLGGGFGLTKALATATRFGGTLALASAVGEGTCVTIRIPQPDEPLL